MTKLAEKPRLLMVCAHEPTMDPRIRWEAERAASLYDVTVLGFSKEGSKLDVEFLSGYKIIRLTRCDMSPLQYLLHLKATLSSRTQAALLLLTLRDLAFPVHQRDRVSALTPAASTCQAVEDGFATC